MSSRVREHVRAGVGTSQDITTHDGRTLGVVTRPGGGCRLVLYAADGATPQDILDLDEAEADAVARLMATPRLVSRLTRMQHEADAVLTEQLAVPPHSPYVSCTIADTRTRSRTGASIVAILRHGAVQPMPGPDFVLYSGDLVVTVGTREGIDKVAHILDGTG